MLLQLHISERTGRGVPKITEVYGKETYEFRENSIVVSIPFTRVQMEENTQVDLEKTYDIPQVIPQVAPQVVEEEQYKKRTEKILQFCGTPRSILEIAEMLEYKDRKTVRKYLKPLVEQGRLAMTIPDKPNSSRQKYITIK